MMPVPITVGVLTHNAYAFQRFELLEQTLRSIVVAFPDARVCVLDNGSPDGAAGCTVLANQPSCQMPRVPSIV